MSRSKRRPSFPDLDRLRESRRRASASLAERQGAALGREAREQLEPLTKTESKARSVDSALPAVDFFAAMRRAMDSHVSSMMMPSPNLFPSLGFPSLTFRYAEAPPSVDAAKLSALKEVSPCKVERPTPVIVPDMVECITAWRAWGVEGSGGYARLDALGRDALWHPRAAMQAVCLRRSFMGGYKLEHAAPAMDCNCGVWAFKELDGLTAALGNKYNNVRVVGTVNLWGRVIRTENGYRAQYAYPSELWLLDESLEELGLVYDVPVRMIRA